MHGAPALSPGFAQFPYAEPSAPPGGRLTLGAVGGFDTLNPFALNGRPVWILRERVYESLMARSQDEPFTLYGLLAERVSVAEDRSWVEFHVRPEARFSDGAPVTVDDVIFSLEILRDEGRPNFRGFYGQVARIERVGPRGVRFVFAAPNRELPLLLGLMPILPAADWAGRDFKAARFEPPIGSGPYRVAVVDPGRRIELARDPSYWAADLPTQRGRFAPGVIDYQFFGDGAALDEAFLAGSVDVAQFADPTKWAALAESSAALEGRIQLWEIPHGRPSGMRGFVFNTRKPLFADRRVRAALALAFDYEWINARFYADGRRRIESYYAGSSLGFQDPASPEERALLAPYADALPAGALEAGWRPPQGAGDGRNRRNQRAARRLLAEAGWSVRDGALRNAAGEAFAFDIVLRRAEDERVANVFAEALKTLGVTARPRFVDAAQYQERLNTYDFDMVVERWVLSLSPGEEQRTYWGSEHRDAPGARSYMGVADPAVDAMIDAMLVAEDRTAFETAVRALDRVLSAGVYVIPFGYLDRDLVAVSARIRRPADDPLYGFQLDTIWIEEP